jgi:predicted AlkP superfamily pyrophosphatase or phosphodiesterase
VHWLLSPVVMVLSLGFGREPRHVAAVQPPVQAAAAINAVAAALPAPGYPERVLIISIDGLRPDVIDDVRMPRTAQLIREGAIARRAETIPQSDTLPSHASMLSGFGAKAHGLHWNSFQADRGYIHVPTIFSIARNHGKSTAMFVGKPKLRHIAKPGTVDHFERSSYLCGGVTRRAARYFVARRPDLMFVHFSDPDEYGHANGWMSPEYLQAVSHADSCLSRLLAAIDGSGAGASTLIIVTADHGGHLHRHSGGKNALERNIPWIVRGPGVTPSTSLDAHVRTFDTAATALAALRLPPPANMVGQARLTFTP